MGDADVAQGIILGFQENEIEETLEELQENLNTLHLNLRELETRTLQHFQEHTTCHMKAYFTFRCLVIAMNFVLVPVVMAAGLSCILMELIDPNAQDALQGIIQILWLIAASLGASLYLGSIWALHNLPPPDRLFVEESAESLETDDDSDFFDMLMRQRFVAELPLGLDEVDGVEMPEIEQNENDRNEPHDEAELADDESEEVDGETEESQDEFEEAQDGTEEAQNEVEGTEHEIEETENEAKVKVGEAEESEKTADLLRNQEYVQNDMDLQPERSVTIISSAATEETNDTANKNDNAAETVSSQVEADPVTPKTAETVLSSA